MPADCRKTIHSGSEIDSRRGELYLAAADLASSQHEVLKLEHLCGLGLSASGVRHWVAAGHLYRKYQGVFAFGRPDLSAQGHRLAAIFACGQGARGSFVTAGATHEIRATASSYVDVTIPAGTPLRKRAGIRCHRADLLPQDMTIVDGIPVTSVSRTLLDLATVLSESALERAAKQAVVERVFNLREMEDLLSRSKGHRGIRRLRAVLERGDLSADDQPKSRSGDRFRRLVSAGRASQARDQPLPLTRRRVSRGRLSVAKRAGRDRDGRWPLSLGRLATGERREAGRTAHAAWVPPRARARPRGGAPAVRGDRDRAKASRAVTASVNR